MRLFVPRSLSLNLLSINEVCLSLSSCEWTLFVFCSPIDSSCFSFSFVFASHKVVCFLFSLCIFLPITGVCFFFPSPPPPSAYISGVHTSPAYTLHICHNCKPCSVWRGSEKHTAKDGADKDTWNLDGHSMASASRDGSALCSILETSTEEWQMVSGEACAIVRFRHTCTFVAFHSFIHSFVTICGSHG